MKGFIKAYSAAVNAGIITGQDGVAYQFARTAWLHECVPVNDTHVEFTVQEGRALRVIRDERLG